VRVEARIEQDIEGDRAARSRRVNRILVKTAGRQFRCEVGDPGLCRYCGRLGHHPTRQADTA